MLNAKSDSKSLIIPEPEFNRMFSNLKELSALNSDLLKDFETRIAHWDKCKKIADVIVKKGPFLKLYTTYISDFKQTVDTFNQCCINNKKFKK